MPIPHPGGFGLGGRGGGGVFATIFTDVLAGLVFIVCFIVVVGLLFVLVRFLLVATKAAELYIANNSSARKPDGSATPLSSPAAPAETTPTTTSAPSKPTATRAAAPKSPPRPPK